MSRQKAQVSSLAGELSEEAAFLSTEGQPFVTLPTGQTLPLHEPIFRDWLTWRFSQREGMPPTEAALHDGIRLLRARACCEPRRSKVALRVAQGGEGSVYIDLANNLGESVEINEQGWQVTRFTPGVTFRSARGQLPLPKPGLPDSQTPGLLDSLPLRNWLLTALRPRGPYPVLILHGPPGSGKTTLARMLRGLLDPVTAPITALPSRERAIEKAASINRVLVFDHVTHMSNSAADALCRIASGTGITVPEPGDRRDPLMLDIARPIILTTPRQGLDDWQPRADLASRAITVQLPAIANHRSQEEIEAEFEAARPQIQAALYTALSQSLANKNDERPTTNDERTTLYESSAAADPLYQATRTFVAERSEWTGTAADLLPQLALTNCASPRALSQRLNLLSAFLAAAGVALEHHRKHNGTRQITLRTIPENLRHPDPPGSELCTLNSEPRPLNSEL